MSFFVFWNICQILQWTNVWWLVKSSSCSSSPPRAYLKSCAAGEKVYVRCKSWSCITFYFWLSANFGSSLKSHRRNQQQPCFHLPPRPPFLPLLLRLRNPRHLRWAWGLRYQNRKFLGALFQAVLPPNQLTLSILLKVRCQLSRNRFDLISSWRGDFVAHFLLCVSFLMCVTCPNSHLYKICFFLCLYCCQVFRESCLLLIISGCWHVR